MATQLDAGQCQASAWDGSSACCAHQHAAQLLRCSDGPRAKGAGPPGAGWQRRWAGLCASRRRPNHQAAPASQRRPQRRGWLGRRRCRRGGRRGGLGSWGLGQQAVQTSSHQQRRQQRQCQPCTGRWMNAGEGRVHTRPAAAAAWQRRRELGSRQPACRSHRGLHSHLDCPAPLPGACDRGNSCGGRGFDDRGAQLESRRRLLQSEPTHPHRASASKAAPASSRAGRRWAGAGLPFSSAAGSTFQAMSRVMLRNGPIGERPCQTGRAGTASA